MLDERTSAVLTRLNALCEEDGYQIIEEKELIEGLPSKFCINAEGLSRLLNYLKEKRYLDVRYAKEGVYCVCLLPEARLYFEQSVQEKIALTRRDRKSFFVTMAAAFAGSMLGCLIFWLISAWR